MASATGLWDKIKEKGHPIGDLSLFTIIFYKKLYLLKLKMPLSNFTFSKHYSTNHRYKQQYRSQLKRK